MSNYTTLSIGGPAKEFIEVSTEEELINTISKAIANHKSYLVIGGGSNLLVSDQGVDQLVIKNSSVGISQTDDLVTVQAGTPLQLLVDYTIEHGLAGLNKLTGIPGTVGGAVYGNAGAYGQTVSDHLLQVKTFNGSEVTTATKANCHFDYRDSDFKTNGLTILEVTFQLSPADPQTLKQEAMDTLEKRLKKYPPGMKCPGSFFKNLLASHLPQEVLDTIPNVTDYYGKVPAWIFLERVGAKGMTLGGVAVADFHGNLIYNTGHATAQNFWDLTHDLAMKVKDQFGVTLEPEVQLVGLPPII